MPAPSAAACSSALGRATTQQQIDSLRARLRNVRSQIARLNGDLDALRRRADLSTVSVTVRGDGARRPSDGGGSGGNWSPGDAARDAVRVLEVIAGVDAHRARDRWRRSRCSPLLVALGVRSDAPPPPRERARRRLSDAARTARHVPRGRGLPAPRRVWYCSRMDTREQPAVALLAHVPVFETLGPRELAQVAAVTVPRTFDAGHVIFREGDAQRHVLHRPHRPRPRGPRARRRPHADARALRSRRHLRRAGDVRRRAPLGDRRDARPGRRASRCSGPTCAACCASTPTSR